MDSFIIPVPVKVELIKIRTILELRLGKWSREPRSTDSTWLFMILVGYPETNASMNLNYDAILSIISQ